MILIALMVSLQAPLGASTSVATTKVPALKAVDWMMVAQASTVIAELRARHQVFFPYFSAQASLSTASLQLAQTLRLNSPQGMVSIPQWIVKIIKAAVDQVIKAMNLAIQRLQNSKIKEMNALKVAEAIIHSKGIQKGIDIAKKGRDLYQKYYDDLKVAKNIIKTIQGIFDLATLEKTFLSEFGEIINMLSTGTFTPDEVDVLTRTANAILDKATHNITDIKNMVLALAELSMDDQDRLQLVLNTRDKLHSDLTYLRKLRRDVGYIAAMRGLPGVENNLDLLLKN